MAFLLKISMQADTLATIVMQPLVAIDGEKSYDIKINVKGGGLTGQGRSNKTWYI